MRVGTGIQNKVLEAMAAGTPVVTTKRVADAVGAVHGQHLLMADGAEDFADATVRVMTDVDLASSLAIAARRLVEEQFPWEVSASGIERLWERVAGLHR
jgi:glycosyltransferase involved in cell wall biosynthesis